MEVFKDVLVTYFEKLGCSIDRDKIFFKRYEEFSDNITCTIYLPFMEYNLYTITYNKNTGEFVLEEYQKIKICRLTQDEEQVSE